MKNLELSKIEKSALYTVLIQPDENATYRDVYFRGKILEMLESEKKKNKDGTMSLSFNDKSVEIEENDFLRITEAFKKFKGWNVVSYPIINSLIKKLDLEKELIKERNK